MRKKRREDKKARKQEDDQSRLAFQVTDGKIKLFFQPHETIIKN